MVQPVAEELDELADHALAAQDLHDGQHQVGGGGALRQPAMQVETDDLRDEHGDRLAEHGGLGLDAADTPAQHTETVDHGGVRISADQGVRVGLGHAVAVAFEHHPGEVLQVDLVHDTRVGRYHAKIREGLLAPFQKAVALLVALVFQFAVEVDRTGRTVAVHLHGMVDDQLGRLQGIDAFRITAQLRHGVAHGGEVDHGRHAGKVLHQHARRSKGDFHVGFGLRVPVEQSFDVRPRDSLFVLIAQQVLQQYPQCARQAADVVRPGQFAQAEYFVGLAPDLERVAGVEAVVHELSVRLAKGAQLYTVSGRWQAGTGEPSGSLSEHACMSQQCPAPEQEPDAATATLPPQDSGPHAGQQQCADHVTAFRRVEDGRFTLDHDARCECADGVRVDTGQRGDDVRRGLGTVCLVIAQGIDTTRDHIDQDGLPGQFALQVHQGDDIAGQFRVAPGVVVAELVTQCRKPRRQAGGTVVDGIDAGG